jgi:sec-independent protein translocase protein TatA
MPNLGFPEIAIILLVALLVFGPKKLPDLGKSLGNGIREFRRGTQGLKDELEGSLKDAPARDHSNQENLNQATPLVVQASAAVQNTIAPPVQAVILPSAPVAHVAELGKPAQEEAPKI